MRELIAVALTILSSAISADVMAQSRVNSDRFVNVGVNEVVLLDRNSIKNSRFQLVLQSGDGGYQIEQYHVLCSRKAYSLLNVRIYDASDRLTTFLNHPTDPKIYSDGSAIGRAAAIVCQNR